MPIDAHNALIKLIQKYCSLDLANLKRLFFILFRFIIFSDSLDLIFSEKNYYTTKAYINN